MSTCNKCGVTLPQQTGRGRPRSMCTDCSPRRTTTKLRPVTSQPVTPPVVEVDPPESVKEAVTRELVAAGRRWSSAGMAAVLLAQKLDESAWEPGTGAAVLARQLSATMGEAMSDANVDTADDLDRLLADG